jgi:glyoxylase I family protein
MMTPKFIDHIVIMVKDIRETEKFYSIFLGKPKYLEKMQVIYKIGDTKVFFIMVNGEWQLTDKDRGGLNHLAFGVSTGDELRKFEKILGSGNIKNSGIRIDKYGNKEYIWFDDPNGIRLEIYCRGNE